MRMKLEIMQNYWPVLLAEAIEREENKEVGERDPDKMRPDELRQTIFLMVKTLMDRALRNEATCVTIKELLNIFRG